MLSAAAEDESHGGNRVIDVSCWHRANSREKAECSQGYVLLSRRVGNMQDTTTWGLISERRYPPSSFIQAKVLRRFEDRSNFHHHSIVYPIRGCADLSMNSEDMTTSTTRPRVAELNDKGCEGQPSTRLARCRGHLERTYHSLRRSHSTWGVHGLR